jgi:hypothetical protein
VARVNESIYRFSKICDEHKAILTNSDQANAQVCTCIRALKVFQICSLRVIFLGEDVSDACKVHELSFKLIVKMEHTIGEKLWQLFAYTCTFLPLTGLLKKKCTIPAHNIVGL